MPVDVIRSAHDIRERVRAWQRERLSVGLVPTMGALHEGHLSLVRASAAECGRTVVSIFVNRTQFAPGEDFDCYPRRLEADAEFVTRAGADTVFAPDEGVMYEPGFCTWVVQDGVTERLCGAFRPGHFRGVLTIVAKLLNTVPAERAYFGRKDFQQCVVIRRMAADLNLPAEIRIMPTVRESDGLAMSSRNEYLTPSERRQAVCLFQALQATRRLFAAGETSPAKLVGEMRRVIAEQPDARPQYVEIVSPETLEAETSASGDSVAALAVFLGATRLIDNMPLGEDAAPP